MEISESSYPRRPRSGKLVEAETRKSALRRRSFASFRERPGARTGATYAQIAHLRGVIPPFSSWTGRKAPPIPWTGRAAAVPPETPHLQLEAFGWDGALQVH